MRFTEHRYTAFDGLSLYYRVYGEGENVVLCLPGLTRNCKDFEGIAGHLADRWRVVTPDLRGRGESERDPNWKQYLPPTYVKDAWGLLDELGVERCAVIGTSLGGLMSMIMADQHPERLRGIVLNDVGPEVTPEALARISTYVGATPAQPDWATAARMAKKNYALAYPDAEEDFWLEQAKAAWREREDGMLEPAYDPAIGDALREALKSVKLVKWMRRFGLKRMKGLNLDPWDNFRAITMPCLLLRGELSDVISPEIVQRMQAIKPDLEVVTVPRRGHVPTLTEPLALDALNRFLASI
ncbi:MAG: alpha/beta hydrolase [Xanthomonadales bacterium]|jgi:pimeloyl-ACP methyl ester carboxylesterase|nr:alpha/beta hydrolase [Xanthomonadales bacterium]